jgi:hypothetical protein
MWAFSNSFQSYKPHTYAARSKINKPISSIDYTDKIFTFAQAVVCGTALCFHKTSNNLYIFPPSTKPIAHLSPNAETENAYSYTDISTLPYNFLVFTKIHICAFTFMEQNTAFFAGKKCIYALVIFSLCK